MHGGKEFLVFSYVSKDVSFGALIVIFPKPKIQMAAEI
jgi:hypothetical protein